MSMAPTNKIIFSVLCQWLRPNKEIFAAFNGSDKMKHYLQPYVNGSDNFNKT